MVTAAEAATTVEKLLAYGCQQGLINKYDSIIVRNQLLDKLNLSQPTSSYAGGLPTEDIPDSPRPMLEMLVEYALEEEIIARDTPTHRDLFDTELMGALMPRQSEVIENFWVESEQNSMKAATDYFYQLAQQSNYIRKERIERNSRWQAETEWGELEITINLAKPEKDPDEIAAAGQEENVDYPRCPLCVENVGYAGRLDHPARHNLRVIPFELQGEEWFLQYSPYVYYQEHCIVLSARHEPMNINRDTFTELLEFLDVFPHYFIGSNADLPLVGGSILNHDHFQGGRYEFPMERSDIALSIEHPDFTAIEAGVVNWPLSVIRLRSSSASELVEAADRIHNSWQDYSDPDRKILAYTQQDGEKTKHNTTTPIARYIETEDKYELDLVLRNNRRSRERPAGVFHPRESLHHIKKENIGLIEVMGMAVLPGRLHYELEELKKVLTGKYDCCDLKELGQQQELDLAKHCQWLEKLVEKYGQNNSEEQSERLLHQETAQKFCQVLKDAGVFKWDAEGRRGIQQFLQQVGWKTGRWQEAGDLNDRK